MILSVDGGCSQISSFGAFQMPHHRRFLALMVVTPRSLAPVPSKGPTVDLF
jgi:hypothetical protein